MRWVIERGVFGSGQDLSAAARAAGDRVVIWDDGWWSDGGWPALTEGPALFHGSLGNADRIRRELPWSPGAFCDTGAFACSAWYPRAAPWLLHSEWTCTTAEALVASPPAAAAFFVRPDSPLKPFSGRVLRREQLSLAALDFGYYYEDPALPVIVAPVRAIEREWRYVVVNGHVVAGSAYAAEGRAPLPDDPQGAPWRFAEAVAAGLEAPEAVYVLDVCSSDGALRLLELNPFSGADLYACDPHAVVRAVRQALGAP